MSYDPLSSGQNAMPAAAPSDASANTAYRVTLPEFEGPLDLLLHLCQTHELDILNISIAFIAQKYIEYLELMEGMSVEIAADYLVMAAHLAYLKSRELVPSPEPIEASEDGEEPVDPREELIRRLLEYQKYKHAAEDLGNRPIEGRNVFVRGVPLEAAGEAGLAEHSVWKLLEHWAQILEKAKPKYTHDVVVDRMSITDRINEIVDVLEGGKGRVRFEDLLGDDLPEAELRHKIVVSLLAVLELARLRVIRVLQEEATGTFFLAQVEGAGLNEARNLTVTSATVPDSAPQADAVLAQVAQGGVAVREGAADEVEPSGEEPEAGEQSLEALAQDLEAEAAGLEAFDEEADLELAELDASPEDMDVGWTRGEATSEHADSAVTGGEAPTEDTESAVADGGEAFSEDAESVAVGAQALTVGADSAVEGVHAPAEDSDSAVAGVEAPAEDSDSAVAGVEAPAEDADSVVAGGAATEEGLALPAEDLEPGTVEESVAAEALAETPVDAAQSLVQAVESCAVGAQDGAAAERAPEVFAEEVEVAEAPVGEIVPAEGQPDHVAGDAIEVLSHDVLSASFPASADQGEEVTDGQTQEEQRQDTDSHE